MSQERSRRSHPQVDYRLTTINAAAEPAWMKSEVSDLA
jgi:hypothetical protein